MPKKTEAEIAALLNRCVLLRLKANALSRDAESVAKRVAEEKRRQTSHEHGAEHKLGEHEAGPN